MSEPEKTPHEFIKDYYPLEGCVAALVELAKVNPSQLQAIIELAMTYGIHSEKRRIRMRVDHWDDLIDPSHRMTYGDLIRSELK